MIRSKPFGSVVLSGEDARQFKAALGKPASAAAVRLLARGERLNDLRQNLRGKDPTAPRRAQG